MINEMRQSSLVRALLLPLVILAWLVVLVLVSWLLSHVTHTILVLVLSALIAFALTPLVTLLSRWLPRGLAIAAAYLVGFAVIGGLLTVVVTSAATEVTSLAHNLPTYARRAQSMAPALLDLLGRFGVTQSMIGAAGARAVAYLQDLSAQVASDALTLITSVLNALVDTVLVVILSVYLVANSPRLVALVREQAPPGQARRANLLIAIINQVVGGYVRGTLTMALLVGMLVFVGLTALQVRYALLLGILAFFMEFIPVLGVFISGTVCVLIALFQGGWVLAAIVLAYFVVVHVIEGDVVGPRVMGRAVGIHPAVALLALLAGSELFGLWGALFGAPIAGLVQAIVRAAWREIRVARIEEATAVTPAGPEVRRPESA